MRRWLAAAVVLATAAGVGCWLWPAPEAPGASAGGPTSLGGDAPPPAPVERSLWDLLGAAETSSSLGDGGQLALRGVVVGPDGKPVPLARVEVVVGLDPLAVAHARCPACDEPVFSCRSTARARELAEVLRAGRGRARVLASTVADAQGQFAVAVPAVERLDVRASSGARSGAEVDLDPDALDPDVELEIRIDVPDRIAGRVVDDRAAPIAGARVLLANQLDGATVSVVTGPDGRFDARCPSSPCTAWLFLEADGYAPAVASDVFASGVEPDDEFNTIALARPYSLEITTRAGPQPVEADLDLEIEGHKVRRRATGGRLTLSELAAPDLTVEAFAQGLASGQQQVFLEPGHNVLELSLRRAARLLVEVLDPTGAPAQGVSLTLTGPDTDLTEQVDEKGALTVFGPLGEGAYKLVIQSDAWGDATLELLLEPGDNHVSHALQPPLHLRGRVQGPGGKPAVVYAVSARLPGDYEEVSISDGEQEEGAFALKVPHAGPWEIRALGEHQADAALTARAPAEGLVLVLQPKAAARVTVTGPSGPEVQARVHYRATELNTPAPELLTYMEGGHVAGGSTDERGVAELWGLPPGPGRLIVSAEGLLPREVPVQAGDPGTVVEVAVRLEPGATVSGRVVDEGGGPVADAAVWAIVEGGPTAGHEPQGTDEQGAFVLKGVPPGAEVKLFAMSAERFLRDPVAARAGARDVKLVLLSKPRVKGRVVDPRGVPVKAFTVEGELFDSGDGRFEVAVEPTSDGAMSFTVSGPGMSTVFVEGRFRPDVGDVVLEPWRELRGVVLDASGRPVSGAEVACSACVASVVSGLDGRVSLKADPSGADSPGEQVQVSARRGKLGAAVWVSLAAPFELRLTAGGRVEGVSYDARGKPAPGAVLVDDPAGGEPRKAVADADGRFSLELPMGQWRLAAQTGFARTVRVDAPVVQVTLGPGPGTCSLEVAGFPGTVGLLPPGGRAPDSMGMADVERAGLELLSPAGSEWTDDAFLAQGLPCGPALLVYESFSGPPVTTPVTLTPPLTRFEVPERNLGPPLRPPQPTPPPLPGP